MALPTEPRPAKLVVGLLAAGPGLLAAAEQALEEGIAMVESRSADVGFDFTGYYAAEMGPRLTRRWVCLAGTVPPDRLAAIKLQTNLLEARFLDGSARRRVNIDPGVLTLHNLVLASCKDHAHRVALGRGVYAEVTLVFRDGAYEPLAWTYPDYRIEACRSFLLACRARLTVGAAG